VLPTGPAEWLERDRTDVQKLKQAGLQLHVWTINDAAVARKGAGLLLHPGIILAPSWDLPSFRSVILIRDLVQGIGGTAIEQRLILLGIYPAAMVAAAKKGRAPRRCAA